MSDEHIEICERVEKYLVDKFGLEQCQGTYEIAQDVVEIVLEAVAKYE